MVKKKWTDELMQEVVKRKEGGETIPAIAKDLGHKVASLTSAFYAYRAKMKKTKRPYAKRKPRTEDTAHSFELSIPEENVNSARVLCFITSANNLPNLMRNLWP